jgi:hypothetical protein
MNTDKVMDKVMDNSKTRYLVNEQVVVTDLGDELVLMEPASGKMFSLNSSGRTLWRRLPATAEELAEALCEAFEVSLEEARVDSAAWLASLSKVGLVKADPQQTN